MDVIGFSSGDGKRDIPFLPLEGGARRAERESRVLPRRKLPDARSLSLFRSLPPISLIWRETGTGVPSSRTADIPSRRKVNRSASWEGAGGTRIPAPPPPGGASGGKASPGRRKRRGNGGNHHQAFQQDPAPDRSVNGFQNHPVHLNPFRTPDIAIGYRHNPYRPFRAATLPTQKKKRGRKFSGPSSSNLSPGSGRSRRSLQRSVFRVALVAEHALVGGELRHRPVVVGRLGLRHRADRDAELRRHRLGRCRSRDTARCRP